MVDPTPRVLEALQGARASPLDPLHLTSILEMEGWSDRTAQELGYPDLFALARTVYPSLSHTVAEPAVATGGVHPGRVRLKAALAHSGGAALRSLPVLFVAAAAVALGFAGVLGNLTAARQGAGYALATWLSFLATGGFQQAMAHRGRVLAEAGEMRLLRRACVQLVLAGLLVTAGLGSLLLRWAGPQPAELFAALSGLWLTGGVLRVVGWDLPFIGVTGAVAGATLLALNLPAVGHRLQSAPGLPGPIAILGGIAGAGLVAGFWQLHRLARKSRLGSNPGDPGWRETLTYFALGLLLYACLLLDRVLVWVYGSLTGAQVSSASYDLGMLLAALTFLLPAIIGEAGLHQLSQMLYRRPGALPMGEHQLLRHQATRTWLRVQVALLASGIASLWVVHFLVTWLAGLLGVDLLPNAVTTAVFYWGLPGYVFLAAGLFNVSLLTALNQPGKAIRTLLSAVVVNLAAGWASTWLWQPAPVFVNGAVPASAGYPHAAIGFAAGAAVLWLLGAWRSDRAMAEAEYMLYLNA